MPCTMLTSGRSRAALVLAALVLLPTPIAAQDDSEGGWSAAGGHTVLMEQFTAAWCEICATVDPWMPEFTEANGNRVARVALHDNFEDPLGTPVTDYRIQRYTDGSPSAPSFWFDGSLLAGGAPDRASLHRELLGAEGDRSSDTKLILSAAPIGANSISISVILSEWSALEQTQISLFVNRDSVEITDSEAINGIREHHDVAFAYSEISLSGLGNWSYAPDDGWGALELQIGAESVILQRTLTLPGGISADSLSIVAVHETELSGQGPSTLGALRLDIGEQPLEGLQWWLPVGVVLLASALVALTGLSRR